MPTINYTYRVTAVHDMTMDVVYTHPVHGETYMGVRRPKVGETEQQVIAEYAPVNWWLELEAEFVPVTVGSQGEMAITVNEAPPEMTEAEALSLWRDTISISKLQAYHTLKQWGLYDQVLVLVEALGDPVELAFKEAIEWRRNSPTITGLFSELTLPGGGSPTEETVDQFFMAARDFEV